MAQTKRRRVREQLDKIIKQHFDTNEEDTDAVVNQLMDAVFPSRVLSDQQKMVGVLGWVMDMDPALNVGRLTKFASTLLDNGYRPEEVERWYSLTAYAPGRPEAGQPVESLWRKHWMSKRGTQTPLERDISATISQFKTKDERAGDPDVLVIRDY